MNSAELRQLVERKTKTIKALEALLEKEEMELVDLERRLEAIEDKAKRPDHLDRAKE